MSFLGGAECSTAGNPLTQFTKHVQDDKSLQRDRLVGRGPGGVQEGIRSQGMVGGQDNVSAAKLHRRIELSCGVIRTILVSESVMQVTVLSVGSIDDG